VLALARTSEINRFDLANLIVCCMTCNAAKGPLTESEFRTLLKLLSTWPNSAQVNTLARLRAGARSARWSAKKMSNEKCKMTK